MKTVLNPPGHPSVLLLRDMDSIVSCHMGAILSLG
jgi:hypothetical protein